MKSKQIRVNVTKLGPSLIDLISALIEAGKKTSDGGVSFTADEWRDIGEKAGIIVVRTVVASAQFRGDSTER